MLFACPNREASTVRTGSVTVPLKAMFSAGTHFSSAHFPVVLVRATLPRHKTKGWSHYANAQILFYFSVFEPRATRQLKIFTVMPFTIRD